MIVTRENFKQALDALYAHVSQGLETAIDSETTGLRWAHGDKLFALSFYTGTQGYYFDFNTDCATDIANGVEALPRKWLSLFKPLFDLKNAFWLLANAKFDMHMLANEDLWVAGTVYDVLVHARFEDNTHKRMGLGDCAQRIGFEKSSAVEDYTAKNRLTTKVSVPGKKQKKTNPQYHRVPRDIMAPYALQDTFVTYQVRQHQKSYYEKWLGSRPEIAERTKKLIEMENKLTKVLFKIERDGMKVNVDLCQKALAYEQERMKKAADTFLQLTKTELLDSSKALAPALAPLGVLPGRAAKGGDSFTYDILHKANHPAAQAVLDFRDASKRAGSYYSSFLYFMDANGEVHCNFRQGGARTGRFSISDPALQTLNSEEEDTEHEEGQVDAKVREVFISRPGYFLAAIDYKAFEFRAMLDTAGEKELADLIEKGLDPHRATASLIFKVLYEQVTNTQRGFTKAINFGLLYGMGDAKLARTLGISLEEAKALKALYFENLPMIKRLIREASFIATKQGYVLSRFCRPYRFPYVSVEIERIDEKTGEKKKERESLNFSYKALNALIQGGTADAVKFAMCEIHDLLVDKKSRMILQIHDELLFEIHETEVDLIPQIKTIMEKAWPSRFHPMECSIEWGYDWAKMHAWETYGAKA